MDCKGGNPVSVLGRTAPGRTKNVAHTLNWPSGLVCLAKCIKKKEFFWSTHFHIARERRDPIGQWGKSCLHHTTTTDAQRAWKGPKVKIREVRDWTSKWIINLLHILCCLMVYRKIYLLMSCIQAYLRAPPPPFFFQYWNFFSILEFFFFNIGISFHETH